MRIISGSARGRPLRGPEGQGTRPITDRAKEGIFNMLMPLVDLDGAEVVDLYAGSGSFGLECLSRGAERVTFVEQARPALVALRHNIESLGFADRARVLVGPVAVHGPALGEVDLAFCDPPYADDPWTDLFAMLRAGIVVGHAEREIPVAPGWVELRRRTYGRAQILIAERETAAGESLDG